MASRSERLFVIIGSGPAVTRRPYTRPALCCARCSSRASVPAASSRQPQTWKSMPGISADIVRGTWLMEQMRAQALHVGAEIVPDHISSVDFSRRPFLLNGDSGTVYHAEARDHLHRSPSPVARELQERAKDIAATASRLRNLRRLFLSRRGFPHRGQQRQYGCGGSAFSYQFARTVTGCSSPRFVPHREDSAKPAFRKPEDQSDLECDFGRGFRLWRAQSGDSGKASGYCDRRNFRSASGWRVHRHRARAGHSSVQRAGGDNS